MKFLEAQLSSSPMKVRMDLRDHWENHDSPAQSSVKVLQDLIGLPVIINLEPAILWAELGKYYPDQAVFIPSVTGVVKAWCDALAERFQDDVNAEWTEQFLEVLNDNGKRLEARVEAKSDTKVSTSLTKPAFIINIPQTAPPYRGASGYFATDFQTIFATNPAASTSHENDDWASESLPSRLPQPQNRSTNAAAATSTELPTLTSLPRPEILFSAQTPYHLMVKIVRDGLHIYCSHQGSLELLSGYLTKYVRNIDNPSIGMPIATAELKASDWGYGALYDCLSVSIRGVRGPTGSEDINPILILAFVEGILGFRPVGNESGGNGGDHWYFKRDVGFRQ